VLKTLAWLGHEPLIVPDTFC